MGITLLVLSQDFIIPKITFLKKLIGGYAKYVQCQQYKQYNSHLVVIAQWLARLLATDEAPGLYPDKGEIY